MLETHRRRRHIGRTGIKLAVHPVNKKNTIAVFNRAAFAHADAPGESAVIVSEALRMRYVVWGLVILLLVLRQDFWNWTNTKLLFGFLPAALFSQACISLSATCVWWLAVNYAWPRDPDAPEFARDAGVDPSVQIPAPANDPATGGTN